MDIPDVGEHFFRGLLYTSDINDELELGGGGELELAGTRRRTKESTPAPGWEMTSPALPPDLADLRKLIGCANVKEPNSRKQALAHRKLWHVPRRIRDTLAEKHYFEKTKKRKRHWRRAAAGEEGGVLYSLFTSSGEIGAAWGLGVGLYLDQLLGLSLVLVIWGSISMLAAHYYASPVYSDGQHDLVDVTLTGSAACTRHTTISLTDCGDDAIDCTRIANDCPYASVIGTANLIGSFVFLMAALIGGELTIRRAVFLDDSVQTAQDYTVEVQDPDADADSPQEWADFFSQYGEVAYVTIARDNGALLERLALRSQLAKKLRMSGEIVSQDYIDTLRQRNLPKSSIFRRNRKRKLVKSILRITQEINALVQFGYFPVVRVYVTFEHEHGQRRALNQLSSGLLATLWDWGDVVYRDDMFRGMNTLCVVEPPEPSEVIWQNLSYSRTWRTFQALLSFSLTLLVAWGAYELIKFLMSVKGTEGAAFAVSLLSMALPMVLKVVTSLERHLDLGDAQQSLIRKLLISRILTSVVILFVGTSWDDWLDEEQLNKVQALLFADAVTSPLLRAVDIGSRVKRHVMSRMAATQEKANSLMKGTYWSLGERYTDAIKTVVLASFYAALFPTGLYIAASALLASFLSDRYCLLRTWRVPPQLDCSLARDLRMPLLLAALTNMVVTLSFLYSWPFDGLAQDEDGRWRDVDAKPHVVLFWKNTAKEWMSHLQARSINTYIIATIAVAAALLCVFLTKGLVYAWIDLFRGRKRGHRRDGGDHGIPFSLVEGIHCYIPMLTSTSGGDSYLAAEVPRTQSVAAYLENLVDCIPAQHRKRCFGCVTSFLQQRHSQKSSYKKGSAVRLVQQTTTGREPASLEAAIALVMKTVAACCLRNSFEHTSNLFASCDSDGDGRLTLSEFSRALRLAGVGIDIVKAGSGMEAIFVSFLPRDLRESGRGSNARLHFGPFLQSCVTAYGPSLGRSTRNEHRSLRSTSPRRSEILGKSSRHELPSFPPQEVGDQDESTSIWHRQSSGRDGDEEDMIQPTPQMAPPLPTISFDPSASVKALSSALRSAKASEDPPQLSQESKKTSAKKKSNNRVVPTQQEFTCLVCGFINMGSSSCAVCSAARPLQIDAERRRKRTCSACFFANVSCAEICAMCNSKLQL